MAIKVKTSGNYDKTRRFLVESKEMAKSTQIKEIAESTLEKLKYATAGYSTRVFEGWSYEIIEDKNSVAIQFNNSYVQDGVNIALLLDTGHGTRGGTWIAGLHYIDPIMRETCEAIATKSWEELKKI